MSFPEHEFAIACTSHAEFLVIKPYLEANNIYIFQPTFTSRNNATLAYVAVRNSSNRRELRRSSTVTTLQLNPCPLYTIPEFLSLLSPPLTNEQILAQFLKYHRKYSAFLRHQGPFRKSESSIHDALTCMLNWDSTSEGRPFWEDLDRKWNSTIERFNLTGTINFSLLF